MKTDLMNIAIREAVLAYKKKEIPVGAVIVDNKNVVVAKSHNLVESNNDPLCHAEILVIKKAMKITGKRYLNDFNLWVTLEPCLMCSGVILASRIKRLYFGAEDKKNGVMENGLRLSHDKNVCKKLEVYFGFSEVKIQKLMKKFFHELRSQ